MNQTISIIIPVYKVEAYLPKCIDSILSQTYTDLEIILVDDGSPDSCGHICDEYAAKDSRIQVIHKKNEGVARARNDGIARSTGAYISFIDSDDWIAKDAYENLYKGLHEYQADCAVGKCITVTEKNKTLTPQPAKELPVFCESREDAMKRVLLQGSAIWNRLFRREIFDTLRFPADRINDDEVVALHAYEKCSRIVFLNKDSYYYRIRPNSITTSGFSRKNMDYVYNSRENMEFVSDCAPALFPCAQSKYIKTLLYCYHNIRKSDNKEEFNDLKKKLQADIKMVRSDALSNSYVPLPYKLLALLYSAGK